MLRRLTILCIAAFMILFGVHSAEALEAPGLSVTDQTYNSISLSWTSVGDGATYDIYRSTSGNPEQGSVLASGITANSYNDSSLDEATTYYYCVKAVLGADSIFSSSKTACTTLQAPTNLSRVNVTDNTVDLAWQNSSANAAGVIVERSGSGVVATLPGTADNFHDSGLTPGATYTYKIKANKGGVSSSYAEISITTTNTSPPTAPSNLSASASSATAVSLSWRDNANNETGYRIERTSGGSTQVFTAGADTTSYSDNSVAASTTYTYKVQAYNSYGDSSFSSTASVTTPSASAPSAPSNLNAAAASSSQINLTWTDNSTNETGFKIERKTSGSFTEVGTTSASINSYSDTGLVSGQTYTYRVRAYNTDLSNYSNETSAATPLVVPTAPSGLSASSSSSTSISLSWVDNANNETGFKLERKISGGSYTEIAQLGANVTGYTDSSVTAGTTYYYRIYNYNSAGNSSYSTEVSAVTVTSSVPAAPSSLSATYNSSNSRINLYWTDNSSNETRFYIERKTSSGSYSELTYVSSNTTYYYDTSISNGYTYYYRVRAYNSYGYSSYCSEANATTTSNGTPSAPDDLDAAVYSSSRINLTWDDNSNNETRFYIERKTGSSGSYSQIEYVTSNTTSYSDTGLSSGTKYYYRVRAYNSNGYSSYSNEDYATTSGTAVPDAPSDLSAYAASNSRITLSWDDNSDNETKFYIERKTSSGSYSELGSVSASTTTYSDTSFTAGTTYYYRVRAYNSSGYSSYCSEARVTASGNTVPSTPSNLIASSASGYIGLSWTDNAGNETNYVIERKTANTSYAMLTTLSANVTSYSDYTAASGVYYTYRVRGYNSNGYSEYSNTASAQSAAVKNEIRFSVGKTTYYCKGKQLVMDAAPINRNDRVMIPIRYVTDQLGAQISWDNKQQKVTIVYKSKKIELWVNKRVAKVNSVNKYIDTANTKVTPIVIPPGRTMLPIRFVSESLGCQVNWENSTNTAVVTLP